MKRGQCLLMMARYDSVGWKCYLTLRPLTILIGEWLPDCQFATGTTGTCLWISGVRNYDNVQVEEMLPLRSRKHMDAKCILGSWSGYLPYARLVGSMNREHPPYEDIRLNFPAVVV